MGGIQEQGQQDDETVMIPLGQRNQDDRIQALPEELLGKVRASFIEELGVIVLQGNKEDVARVEAALRRFMGSSDRARPIQKNIELKNAQASVIAEVIQEIYDAHYLDREGIVTVQPIDDSAVEGLETVSLQLLGGIEIADVTMGRWAWGSLFLDLNNDSNLDIVVVNGLVTNEDTDDL